VRSTSTSAAVVVPAINDRIIVTMNGILDDALSGLLLLREGIDSNNDSKDHCTTQSSNDSSMTNPSNDSNATHTFDDSSATPTSSMDKAAVVGGGWWWRGKAGGGGGRRG
jgi:hypothetical protein